MFGLKLSDLFESHAGGRWVVVDFLVGVIAMATALQLTPYVDVYEYYNQAIVSIGFGVALALSVRMCGLYAHRMQHLFSVFDILVGAAQAALAAYLTVVFVVSFTHVHVFGRYVAAIALTISFLGIVLSRAWAKWYLGKNPMRIVLCGCNELTLEFGRRLSDDKHFKVLFAACSEECAVDEIRQEFGFRKIEDTAKFVEELSSEDVDLVVSCYKRSIPKAIYELMERLPMHHIDLINKGAFLEIFFREVSVSYRNMHWQSSNFFRPARGAITSLKRILDLCVSIPVFLALLPLMFLVGLLVYLDSKGTIIYKQTRSGLLGHPFTIYKFRTMAMGAEKNGAQWATKNDSRVTKIGGLLRRIRVDELPQLWNVIKGDMSLVGPRPERPELEEMLKKEIPLYEWRHLVKPGLTGWAQILYRYGESVSDAQRKLQYDLFYIKNFSLQLDVQILIRTLHLLMKGSQ